MHIYRYVSLIRTIDTTHSYALCLIHTGVRRAIGQMLAHTTYKALHTQHIKHCTHKALLAHTTYKAYDICFAHTIYKYGYTCSNN